MRERAFDSFARGSLLCAIAMAGGCAQPERQPYSFYDERIAPVIDNGCQRQSTGCHVDDGRGFALGNLDLTTYESLMKRADTLAPYGPYSVGLLLLKAGDPVEVQVETADPPDPARPERRFVTVTTDIRHGGGEGAIAEGSLDYSTLKQWIDGGHTKNGVPSEELAQSLGDCVSGAGALPGLDLDAEPADPESYAAFVRSVQPVLLESCAGSRCHGSPQADLYLTCGDTGRDLRWNYEVALRHLSDQPAQSELLRRPLGLRAGGVYHEGGAVLGNTESSAYKTILAWAKDIADRRPELLHFVPEEPGLRFFVNRVQPVLVRKGCMFLGCHSPAMFHDLRLRGGSRGDFSEIAVRRNYEMSRLMLALESTDPNQSRLVAKNLCPKETGGGGVKHRGGALLEDFGGCAAPETRAALEQCAGVDADAGDLDEVPAYCVIARWLAIEREQAITRGELPPAAGPRGVVYVARPQGVGGPTEFHVFRPGADLVWADASTDAQGALNLGATRSLLAGCGLAGEVDVRGPAVSWDGTRIAFAARTASDRPLRLYEIGADGQGCAPIAGLAPDSDAAQGILLHDFDPAYAPDGRLVFASTRGYLDGESGLSGPTRTPARLEPNANLYVFDRAAAPAVRQLTYLLDQELAPSFMADGRLIFTAEKRGLEFHQLAGRRLNLDGGDYHPLFAQRGTVGFESATEIVELPDRDFAMVAAPLGAADGGGAIVIVNRSIGPDQADRDPGDRSYIRALAMPQPGAFGGGTGVFRSPAPLPSGHLLAACDLEASSLDTPSHFGLCELDGAGHAAPRMLMRDPSRVAVEPVAVYARASHGVFASRSDEVNGSTRVDAGRGDAQVHYLDVPLLGTLLFSNTRIGRPIDARVGGIELFAAEPPSNDATSLDALGSGVIDDDFGRYYEAWRSLGKAPMQHDGSLHVRIPGGTPIAVGLTDAEGRGLDFDDGAPFSGAMRQRETTQFYPGERAKQSMPVHLFDGICAGCHGSVSGRELDIGVDVDVLTSASVTTASDAVVDLR